MDTKSERTLVREDVFTLKSGGRAVVTVWDDANTIKDPEGVRRCKEHLNRVAANIFVRAAMREQQEQDDRA